MTGAVLCDARVRVGTAGDTNGKSSVDQTISFNNAFGASFVVYEGHILSRLRRTRPSEDRAPELRHSLNLFPKGLVP